MTITPALNFFKTTMPLSRKADFHLGCLDGSIFIDINKTNEWLVYLCRISFDGYGCYDLRNATLSLNPDSSREFIEEIEKENLNQESIGTLVKELITISGSYIWKDALKEYGLIK